MLVELKLNKTIEPRQLTLTQIAELQGALTLLDYPVVIDGIFGPNTLQAFNQFKVDQKLTHPGLIGPTTIDVLVKAISEKDLLEDEPKQEDKQPSFKEPQVFSPNKIDWNNFNSPVSKFFTVGEVTQWSRERIPTSNEVKNRAIKLAAELDKIRIDWRSPIGVTSWYRPPAVNKRVGGVYNSRHLFGDAVDIYPIGKNIFEFQRWVDANWHGAVGWGARRGFVHLDRRNAKGWKSGGASGPRWNY